MSQIIVIGGGAAGMMAAVMAAKSGHEVTLVEKNEKLGKKLYITGKGRCNITNASDIAEHLDKCISNSKFLYSAYYTFHSDALIDYMNENGLKTKIERGNRVFPVSNKSSDVIKFFANELRRYNVNILLNKTVKNIVKEDKCFKIVCGNHHNMTCDKVIVATGGISYQGTGSTGDGYQFAKAFDHKIIDLAPGLVPLEVKEDFYKDLQGLSLRNVNVQFYKGKKVFYEGFGEMLFTHFGVSGPLIISGSSYLPKKDIQGTKIVIDLKPSLTFEALDQRVLSDFNKYLKKDIINALDDLLPKKLIPVIIKLMGINFHKKVDQVTKEERLKFVSLLKRLELTVTKTRDFKEAIITRGGVNVKDINPNTMESKKINELYFVGEVLDLDALTGGYNLQIAFSTGYLAGISV